MAESQPQTGMSKKHEEELAAAIRKALVYFHQCGEDPTPGGPLWEATLQAILSGKPLPPPSEVKGSPQQPPGPRFYKGSGSLIRKLNALSQSQDRSSDTTPPSGK